MRLFGQPVRTAVNVVLLPVAVVTDVVMALDVSSACYAEVRALLEAAGYAHAFHADRDLTRDGLTSEVIDMHGLALRAGPADVSSRREIERLEGFVAAVEALLRQPAPPEDIVAAASMLFRNERIRLKRETRA